VVTSRNNQTVFEQNINFSDVNDKELVSKSFTFRRLCSSEDPCFCDVDNSWANVGIGLVNEKTNEVVYASKDIEQYSGYEDGESWSEGSKSEDFNICGVAAGTYHFLVSAEKEGGIADPFKAGYRPENGDFSVIQNETGTYFLQNDKDKSINSYHDRDSLKNKIIERTGLLNNVKAMEK
jgi:hypothetical protein